MFQIDPDPVIRCSSQLKAIQQHAAGIMHLAADADPDWYVWGALGTLFSPLYWHYAEGLYEHLHLMGEALRDRVDSLDTCVDNYLATEAAITRALDEIGKVLG